MNDDLNFFCKNTYKFYVLYIIHNHIDMEML